MRVFLVSTTHLVVASAFAFQFSTTLVQPRRVNRLHSESISQPETSKLRENETENLESLKWQPSGYESWTWKNKVEDVDIKINYVAAGLGKPGTPIVLIHGFGASAFHWRYQIPALARERPVYALDLVGFGLSEKPLVTYSASLWRDQVGAFLTEVVKTPALVAGNSLGGFTALSTAAAFPSATAGCVLLNTAGRLSTPSRKLAKKDASSLFQEPSEPRFSAPIDLLRYSGAAVLERLQAAQEAFSRAIVYSSFFLTKQPGRIKQVLRQVYPVNPTNVDDALVESIRFPADSSPNCAEVFYRVLARAASTEATSDFVIDTLLPKLTSNGTPLWLVWGEKDPWIKPAVADAIQGLMPRAVRMSVDAGHCPHDEAPHCVNKALNKAATACDEVARY